MMKISNIDARRRIGRDQRQACSLGGLAMGISGAPIRRVRKHQIVAPRV